MPFSQTYTEWSAGVLIAVVDPNRRLRWWNDQLLPEDRQYARNHFPRYDINRKRVVWRP